MKLKQKKLSELKEPMIDFLEERPLCGTGPCPYWDRQKEKSQGFCRRHAPRHIIAASPDHLEEMNDFALVSETDWCGDHPLFYAWLNFL